MRQEAYTLPRKERDEGQGESNIGGRRAAARTLASSRKENQSDVSNTYMAIFACISGDLTITDNSIAKTNNRFTAENSLLEAICYLIVVAMTHFYLVDTEDLA